MKKFLNLLLILTFLFSTGMFFRGRMDKVAGQVSYEEALQVALSAEAVETPTEVPETTAPAMVWVPVTVQDAVTEELASIDLHSLRAVNPDVLGWIRIPGTRVDYPILQGEDNEFYLKHTWQGDYNEVGSIFLEWQEDPKMADFNTIIYGHKRNDGSMFGQLLKYADPEFLAENPYVYILSDSGIYRYEIFAAYPAPLDAPAYGLSFNQTETRERFLASAAELSQVRTGITPAVTDRIVTLSTCSGEGYHNRWVVQARLEMVSGN